MNSSLNLLCFLGSQLTTLKYMKDLKVVSDQSAIFKCFITAKNFKKNVEYKWLVLL